MNKRIVHDALILTAFTLVLGFILALVQGITAEPIDKANKAAAQKAYQAVFSDAKSFENIVCILWCSETNGWCDTLSFGNAGEGWNRRNKKSV